VSTAAVTSTTEITSREALEILPYADASAIVRLVREGRLIPTRKLPGRTGAYLFDQAAVVALAESIAAAKAKPDAPGGPVVGEVLADGPIAAVPA
jgi:hypothetical protein